MNQSRLVLEFSGPFFWVMDITIGLTTPEELAVFCDTARYAAGVRYRRRWVGAKGAHTSAISLCFSVANRSPCALTKAPVQASNGGQTLQPWPPCLLALASKRQRRKVAQIHPIRDTRCRSDCLDRAIQFRDPLIDLDCKLSHRRLECKQNFRQKRPQNRLRIWSAARDPKPNPDLSLNPMWRCNLNLVTIGVFPWPMHATL